MFKPGMISLRVYQEGLKCQYKGCVNTHVKLDIIYFFIYNDIYIYVRFPCVLQGM